MVAHFRKPNPMSLGARESEESPGASPVHTAWGFFPFAKLRVRMTRCTQFGPPIRVSLRMHIYEMAFTKMGSS